MFQPAIQSGPFARLLFLVFALIAGHAVAAPSPAFVAGDRWVAIGDSITHDGPYPRYVDLFQVLRHPDQPVTYSNAGVSGDSAAGALRRFDWDIIPQNGPAPTVATIMLGMNDCGRDLYAANSADDDAGQQKRRSRLDNYAKSMRTLVERLQARGVRVILMTPSPYDDTSAMDKPNLPGVNGALAACADIARTLASEYDLAVIDLHGPLTALNQRLQKAAPQFTMISGDRVHPGPPGSFAMAYHILRAQNRAGPFVQVQLNAATAQVRFARGAAVSDFSSDAEDGLTFAYLADSLPVAVPANTQEALAWVPFSEEFNREELRVSGLQPGDYTLAIDEKSVGTFSAQTLGLGIDLAALPTPQIRQAKDVLALMEARWDELRKLRLIASIEYWRLPEAARPLTLDKMEPLLAAWEKELSAVPNHWQRTQPGKYREWKPLEAKIKVNAEKQLEAVRAAARPVRHTITLRRILPPATTSTSHAQ